VNAAEPETDLAGALLIRIAAQDHNALVDLYALTSRYATTAINALLRSAAHSEEVTQEVYLQIWLSAASAFNPGRGTGHGFIVALARRRAIDRIRSVERSRRRETAWTNTGDPTWDFSDVIIDRVRLQEALGALGGQAQTIVDVYYRGMTYKEMAQHDGVTVAAIKSRHRRALASLRGLVDS
jgi:RNA polymerase sigma-70 factor (ECF subfamily)